MDEVEIVRNIEDAGFVAKRRNMHYEILGDPIFRERDVPRMLELATARADGDTQRARGAAQLSGAQPRRRRSARSAPCHLITLSRAAWILSDRASRRSATAASRSTAVASSRVGDPRRRWTAARSDLGDVAHPARPRQRAHAPRAVVLRDAVPPAASMPAWAAAAHRASDSRRWRMRILEAIAAAIGEARGSGTLCVRRHQQHAGDVRAAGCGGESVARRVSRADRVHRRRTRRRSCDRAIERAAALPQTARLQLSLAAHAPYSVSPALFAAIARTDARAPSAASIWRSRPRRSSSCATGSGPWRSCSRSSASGIRRGRRRACGPVRIWTGSGSSTPRARRARRADDRPELSLLAAARRNARDLPAQQHGPAPVRRRSRGSTRPACASRSAPTAWPASPDLNVFAELADDAAAGAVGAGARDAATAPRGRARALGFARDYGTIEPGKRAALLAVGVPAGRDGCGRISGQRDSAGRYRWVEVEP